MSKSYVLSMFAAAFITTGIAASPDAPDSSPGFAPLAAALVPATTGTTPAAVEPIIVALRYY